MQSKILQLVPNPFSPRFICSSEKRFSLFCISSGSREVYQPASGDEPYDLTGFKTLRSILETGN